MINISNKKLFFISPHFDDAALSAGGLISSLSGKADMTLINVFTKPSDAQPSMSVKKMLTECDAKDSRALFDQRLTEDTQAFKGLKIKIINLDFIDALWRQKKSNISTFIPEMGYVYPIFSLFAKRGKISKNDNLLIANLKLELKKIITNPDASLVFCPLGLGSHVDHLIVKKIASELFSNVIFWSDYPYNQEDKTQKKPTFTFKKNMHKKQEMISNYKSQLNLLFKSKKLSRLEEKYYAK